MIKGGPSQREEEKKESFSSQSRPSLLQEAKDLGWKYWARVIIGFFVMIFLAASVCNAYLYYSYKTELQNPCKVCRDLNPMTETCIPSGKLYMGEKETWITLRPLKALGDKARKLQLPCDACGELNPDHQQCLQDLFAPKREMINKKINFNFSELNLTPVVGDTSS